MAVYKMRYVYALIIMVIPAWTLNAGPPFNTDDPQPVSFRHWEYYISSVNLIHPAEWSGTSPHFEVNYGLIKNMQVHLLLPFNYSFVRQRGTKFGYADSELGIKYCFIQETDKRPQIGTFPIFEIPTVRNDEFSNGRTRIFIPIWAQKSWDRFTTYGGAGYWFNPGTDNRNYIFSGWELQYDFSKVVTLGGEIEFQSASTADSRSVVAFNIGGYINMSRTMHFIFSFGHSLINENFFSSYLGFLCTI
jgi:hypothetical protein